MADEELAQGPEEETVTEGQQGAEAGAEAEKTYEPTPYDDLAREMGWTPPDQYQGPQESFKSAEQFIRDGREIQKTQSSELKAIRGQLDVIARTSASVAEQEAQRRFEELAQRHAKAVDEGDTVQAFNLAKDMTALAAPQVRQPQGPPPESLEWAERNKWFSPPNSPRPGGDAYASAVAVDVCNRMAALGYDNATQLREAEKVVFGQNTQQRWRRFMVRSEKLD